MTTHRSRLIQAGLLAALASVFSAGCVGTEDGIEGTLAEAVVCADGATVEGIDVSVYQGRIDWAAVKRAGKGFGIARVSYGTGTIDSTFAANWSGMRAAGIIRGAYQYFRPSQDAIAQAEILVRAVGKLGPGDLPPVIDVESTDGQSAAVIAAKIAAWMTRVRVGTGRTPVIYTGRYFWNDYVRTANFTANPLWVPYYDVRCPTPPAVWRDWTFHQYTDNGRVGGISGAVDLDRFNGSLNALRSFAGYSTTSNPDAGMGDAGVGDAGPHDAGTDAQPDGSPMPDDAGWVPVPDDGGEEAGIDPSRDWDHDGGEAGSDGDSSMSENEPRPRGCSAATLGAPGGSATLVALALALALGARRRASHT